MAVEIFELNKEVEIDEAAIKPYEDYAESYEAPDGHLYAFEDGISAWVQLR